MDKSIQVLKVNVDLETMLIGAMRRVGFPDRSRTSCTWSGKQQPSSTDHEFSKLKRPFTHVKRPPHVPINR